MNRMISFAAVAALLIPRALLLPAALAAQAPLQRVEELASHAQADSARAILELWWEEDWPDAPREQRQHGLWLRGRLTVDPFIAELDYQRLVEEFPGGPYSAQALSRLALLAVSTEDPLRAAEYYESLVSEYPNSTLRAAAREWLRENAQEVSRARSLADADGEEAEPRSTPEEAQTAPVGRQGEFAVQLGAFSDTARARVLADRLREAGYDARLVRVPTNLLVRVRLGHFGERDAAVRMMLEIREAGFEATLVTDATREEDVR